VTRIRHRASLAPAVAEAHPRLGRPRPGSVHAQGAARARGARRRVRCAGCCDVLAALTVDDFAVRLESEATGEWMYVFKPAVAGTIAYLKLVVRAACAVVSFHEDESEADADEEQEP